MKEQLQTAIASKDPDAVEEILTAAIVAGKTDGLVPELIELLQLSWHSRHEDVALAIQKLRTRKAIPALKSTALRNHPQYYDDGLALARKCTWALADIGTPEALEALEELSTSPNTKIAEFAFNRLKNWNLELHRKGDAQHD